MPKLGTEPGWTEILLEEYRSVRQESLQAIDRQYRILALGTATAGVLLGIGARIGDGQTEATVLLMIVMPTLAAFVVLLWLGEMARMVRAGAHIADLEVRIATRHEDEEPPLVWETLLRNPRRDRKRVRNLYPAIFAVITLVLGVAGAAVGAIGLTDADHRFWFVVLTIGDVAGLAFVARLYVDHELRLRAIGGEDLHSKELPKLARILRCGNEAREISEEVAARRKKSKQAINRILAASKTPFE